MFLIVNGSVRIGSVSESVFQEIQARTPSVAGSRRPSGSGNSSFFPFPPLQRRLSEALLALGSCRTGGAFESNNLGFHRGRLQPAASCNTLRVPTAESGAQKLHDICTPILSSRERYYPRDRQLYPCRVRTIRVRKKVLYRRTRAFFIREGLGSEISDK